MSLKERTDTPANGYQGIEGFQARFTEIANNVASVVVTSEKNIKLATLGLFAQGHVLLDDLPGVGKTLLAKTIADSIEGKFSRIQFTSDLLPTAFLDCVIIPHQLGQGGHEISEPRHALRALFLPQADRLQHEAFWVQPEGSEVIRTILGEHLGGMNYFRSQHDGFCVDGMHCGP